MNRYEYGKILGQWRTTHFRVGLVAAFCCQLRRLVCFGTTDIPIAPYILTA